MSTADSIPAGVGLNTGNAPLPLAPYLFISITGSPSNSLDRNGLHKYLRRVVSGESVSESTPEAWLVFAAQNHLMAGELPITEPTVWYVGAKRWVTVTWQSEWEAHLHFGFVSSTGRKHTHIELAKDAKHWLPRLATTAKHRWKFKPTVAGEAKISSYDTGIHIVQRQSFLRTLKSKESATTAAGIAVPCIGFLLKNFSAGESVSGFVAQFLAALMVVMFTTILTAAVRHFLVLPKYTWAVAQLEE